MLITKVLIPTDSSCFISYTLDDDTIRNGILTFDKETTAMFVYTVARQKESLEGTVNGDATASLCITINGISARGITGTLIPLTGEQATLFLMSTLMSN